MEDKKIYSLLLEKLSKDLSIENTALTVKDELPIIREFLIDKIKEMMSQNYERFFNNLYRIDVDESKVNKILNSKDRVSIPEKLADLIIERQLLRIKTQLLYKEGRL